MIHLFKGVNQLTILEIEKEFLQSEQNTLFDKKDLFIDLSQVRYAQLSAINYLVLKIESESKKNKIKNLYVSLPTKQYTTGEQNSSDPTFIELKSKLLNSRIKANSFLKNTKFISVIKEGVVKYGVEVFFTERYNFESEFKLENFESAFEEITDLDTNKQLGYNYLYPLEWISINDITINYDLIEQKFNQVLENSNRGIDSLDVSAIKNVIFSELSKNVREHTKGNDDEKRFLLSIGLISSSSIKDKKDNLQIEQEFNDWVIEEKIASLVEIYFGDTGGGFFNKDFIEKCKNVQIVKREEQLKWSFKKWTTKKFEEERRGTKGLYRIDRIVNNYNGIFHIITNDQNGGFRKGGLKNEEWVYRKCEGNFDGTFIQIKLCPYAVVKEFRFTLTENHKERKWKTINIDTTKNEKLILKYIESEFKSEDYLLSIIDLDRNSVLDASGKMGLLSNILLEISYNAHPSGAVVYINSDLEKDTLDTIINSINEFIINKTSIDLSGEKDNEEIYDTVVVIYGNHTYWYGGDQNIINLLNEVYENNFDKKIDELISYQELNSDDKIRVRQNLENDNKLIHVNKQGEIELNFTNLDTHFSILIKNQIELEKSLQTEKLFSPKVQLLDYWIKIENLLKNNEFGYGLTLYLKALEYINQKSRKDEKEQLYFLIDHKQHIKLANTIISLFGLNKNHLINIQDEIQNNSLRRFKLIPEKSNVIILTSIVSSSETIRRLVKYVKRDNAIPILILCLANHRKNKISKLETWESVTEILSVYTENTTEQDTIIRDQNYFKKRSEELNENKYNLVQPNYEEVKWINEVLLLPELDLHLKKSKSLNYNHIGIKNDRHFTFYVDKYKLLNSNSLIWNSIGDKIEIWKTEFNITEFNIYIKNDFLYEGSSELISFLNKKYSNVLIYETLPKIEISDNLNNLFGKSDFNVFIIDFGLISGDTINSMLLSFKGLDNLFICIIFNQSRSKKFDHYLRLNRLDNSPERKSFTNLKIEFLFDFPLNYYNRESCPICDHIDALEGYKINDDEEDYMFMFSEDRQKRLTIREKDEVTNEYYPFDFYYQYPEKRNQELSSEIISIMFGFKVLLEDSLKNTKSRIELFNEIYDIYINKEEFLKDTDSSLYALVYYLSNEVHWLQKEPLVFRDFRDMLSAISNFIAEYDINKLIDIFKQDIKYNINALDSATRYKYSAISLLRSTNKLLFCKNVGKIIMSSFSDNRFSNNLLQNSFFHTYSIYKNKYNKSRNYFSHLIESYKEINRIEGLSEDQKLTSNKLFNLLSSKLTEFDIEKLDDIGIIKQLKKNYEEKYKSQSHPQLETNLSNLSLTHISNSGLLDINNKRESSEYYNSLFIPISNIENDWRYIKHYIYKDIIPYYKKLSDKIKNSDTFKADFMLNVFFENLATQNSYNLLDTFSKMASHLFSNPINYLSIKNQYDKHHITLFDNLIKKHSEFNMFIEQFPVNLKEVFIEKNIQLIFPLLEINLVNIPNVFYPKSRFMKDISNIINSIKARVDEQHKKEFESFGKFKNIMMNLNYSQDDKFVFLVISYNNTNSDIHEHKDFEIGGLGSIKKEIINFGGDLLFEPQNDEDGFFNLTFKFLKYE